MVKRKLSSSTIAGKKKAKPLVHPPKLPSRKQARKLTTEFHKLTRLREETKDPSTVKHYDELIEQMGGRNEYQRASQTSTSFFSTSKWVLGNLSRNGWLHGVPHAQVNDETQNQPSQKSPSGKEIKKRRRQTRLLEVGAINTELLDAAERTAVEDTDSTGKRYNMHVRAIDLKAISERIEESDFLTIPIPQQLYDVIVCSMVLNCVPTADQRGIMVEKLSDFLCVQGLLFFTIPKTCLNLSPYVDRDQFLERMKCVGLDVTDSKETPKVAFFVFRKREGFEPSSRGEIPAKFTTLTKIRRGKKYRNQFAVVFSKQKG